MLFNFFNESKDMEVHDNRTGPCAGEHDDTDSRERPLRDLTGVTLAPEEYLRDFYPRFWRIGTSGGDFWKFERRQTFQERDNPSWDAFARGDWDESLRMLNVRAAELRSYYARIAQHGFTAYRVRVVEDPLTPYIQWLMHSQRQRSVFGERVRVIGPDIISRYERTGPLPEIVILGTQTAYEVLYDDNGAIVGAVRSDDPPVITS